jgi:hypothetical protein
VQLKKGNFSWFLVISLKSSVAEPHHFYAAPAPGTNFDAAPAAPAPPLLYIKAKFLKRTKVITHVETTVSSSFDSVRFILLKMGNE